ncbi:hypothetical protein V6767_17545 [Martelella sp. FLE1502]
MMMTRCDIVAQGDHLLADPASRICGEPGTLPDLIAAHPSFVLADQGYGRPHAADRVRVSRTDGAPPFASTATFREEPIGPSHSHMKED